MEVRLYAPEASVEDMKSGSVPPLRVLPIPPDVPLNLAEFINDPTLDPEIQIATFHNGELVEFTVGRGVKMTPGRGGSVRQG